VKHLSKLHYAAALDKQILQKRIGDALGVSVPLNKINGNADVETEFRLGRMAGSA